MGATTLSAMEHVRVDKWLWAARFFKTRNLATEAVVGGRVHVNGARVKPAKEIRVGDRVEMTISGLRRTVEVNAISPTAVNARALANAGAYLKKVGGTLQCANHVVVAEPLRLT